ncbi:tRNA ligase subunit PheS family protein, partial [Staphylococcus epidermidis]|uniref:tRNA ligase subunit PheS family protein n=1 Tax=Staphylococcus epidermidis TaxID=1282 RepID=UPI003F68B8C2
LLAKKLFAPDREIPLRPSYFPFTQPSLQLHVSSFKSKPHASNLSKHTGSIQILPPPMVHPNVLQIPPFHSNQYSPFPFPIPPHPIPMLNYRIQHIPH